MGEVPDVPYERQGVAMSARGPAVHGLTGREPASEAAEAYQAGAKDGERDGDSIG
jgi:hypothetical protein